MVRVVDDCEHQLSAPALLPVDVPQFAEEPPLRGEIDVGTIPEERFQSCRIRLPEVWDCGLNNSNRVKSLLARELASAEVGESGEELGHGRSSSASLPAPVEREFSDVNAVPVSSRRSSSSLSAVFMHSGFCRSIR